MEARLDFCYCGIWCWHLGKASLCGHCLVKWPSLLGAWGIHLWVASHPCWRDLTFTMDCICWAKKANPFIEQKEPVGTQSSTSQLTSLVGNVYIFFLESQKMDSDFIASILIKCHKIKGWKIFFFTSWIFFYQNLLNEASDSQFSALWPVSDGAALEMFCRPATLFVKCLKVLPMQAWLHFFSEAWQHFLFKAALHFLCSLSAHVQFFKAFKQCNKVAASSVSCLICRHPKAMLACSDFRFASIEGIMDFENTRCHSSYLESSQRSGSVGNKE